MRRIFMALLVQSPGGRGTRGAPVRRLQWATYPHIGILRRREGEVKR